MQFQSTRRLCLTGHGQNARNLHAAIMRSLHNGHVRKSMSGRNRSTIATTTSSPQQYNNTKCIIDNSRRSFISSSCCNLSNFNTNLDSARINTKLSHNSIANNKIMEVPKQPSSLISSLPPMMTSTSLSSSTSNDSLTYNHLPSSSSCSFYSTLTTTSVSSKRRSNTRSITHSSSSINQTPISKQPTTKTTLFQPCGCPWLPSSTPNNTTTTTTSIRTNSTTTTKESSESSNSEDVSMDDEYGTMNASGETFVYPTPYHLESYGTLGHTTSTPIRGILNPAYLNYKTYGKLNDERDNVLVICHALTGNASLEAWWGGLLGPGKAFDTDQYFIVCCNILGSCYGSVSPSSKRPGYKNDDSTSGNNKEIPEGIPKDINNQAIYGIDFPDVSVRDTVRLQLLLLKHELKINSIKCVIGGSFGGMQAVEYCVMAGATRHISSGGNGTVDSSGNVWPRPYDKFSTNTEEDEGGGGENGSGGVENKGVGAYGIGEFVTKRNGRIEPFVRSAVPIACGAAHTAWQIAISETQRQAIYADPKWKNGRYDPHDPPTSGLSVARQVAMVSYRTPLGYHKKFGRALINESGPSYGSKAPWQVKSYLEYQGKKFLDRFDPVTYVKLTEQMDSHDIGRGRGTIEQVLSHVEIPVCVLGIDSDVLYPLREQEEMVKSMPNAELKIIHSDAGHDGFLLEQDQVAAHIKSFLYSHD